MMFIHTTPEQDNALIRAIQSLKGDDLKVYSIDIETTGLNKQKHGITDIAIVEFHLGKPDSSKVFHGYLDPEDYVWSTYCLDLHYNWIREICDRKKAAAAVPRDAYEAALNPPNMCKIYPGSASIREAIYDTFNWYRDDRERITIAGKCVQSFDQVWLEMHGIFDPSLCRKRVMDPTTLFSRVTDTVPPDFQQCLDRAKEQGCPVNHTVRHTALSDAIDIVNLFQWTYRHGHAQVMESIIVHQG